MTETLRPRGMAGTATPRGLAFTFHARGVKQRRLR